MASCMLRSALRQASFRCLRKKCVCPSSRTYASGEILHKAQNKYNVVALGNNNEQHTANCSPWAILDSGKEKHYDLLVIGGGSGGLACSKEVADIGKKAALLDYVSPSPQGTQWGLGGTCVNVGCIPKKLMHQASQLGGAIIDAGRFGWNTPENLQHDWNKLCEGVQGHVRSLNWGFRVQLKTKDVDYYNAKGRLIDQHTVCATDSAGKETILTADNIVIATGMRPKYPTEIPGALEHAISSDDIFWQLKPPGKTLVVGASYVALECAGFLSGLGYDTSVMIRSIPLRGFDQQMAQLVAEGMEDHGTRLIHESVPTSIERHGEQLKVQWRGKGEPSSQEEVFDTVLMAVGRVPETSQLGLREVGVELDEGGFVVGGRDADHERTSVPNIYAVGDVLKDRPELTPVAIRAGRLLARRLFDGATEQMDYDKVATTVFTPVEYSCVGLSEEVALEKYGEDNIEVYHGFYTPLEYTVPGRSAKQCYIKLITERTGTQKVFGIHFMGPNAGEVMQGFAVALRCGMTRDMLLTTVGIHPTSAETVMALHITKRSGLDPTITGC